MECPSPKGFEWVESLRDRAGRDVGSRSMVVFEFPYTRTTGSVGTDDGILGVLTTFSAGSGRLRTVSAGAGMSLTSGTAGSTGAACRWRHQRKRPTARVKNARAPMTAPAITPGLMLEFDDVGLSTHLKLLH